MSEPVTLTINAAGIGVLTVDRPAVRNALNWEAMQALAEAITLAEKDANLQALIVTGAEGTFISGGDLRALHGANTIEDGRRQYDLMADTLSRLAGLPVPVLAAIEGAARGGGCEVALACDLRIMAVDATLGFAQIDMAVTPGWGGAERLHRVAGYTRAMDLLLTGRVLVAEEAVLLGLANYTCPTGKALHMAQMIAGRLAAGPTLAVRGVKRVLGAYDRGAPDARQIERETFAQLWATADHAEASAAFLEKRAPRFRGE